MYIFSLTMFRLLLVCALAIVAVGASPRIRPRVPTLDGRIVGGKDAQIEDYPYQISLLNFGSHFCGGSIIAPNKILTAAHCTYGDSPSNIKIRRGSSIVDEGGVVHDVSEIAVHPLYNSFGFGNDASVLTLAESIEMSDVSQVIELVAAGTQSGGRTAVVTGWGSTQSDYTDQLQVVDVAEVSDEECIEAYGSDVDETMICFASPGKDSCQGDSGGPLAVDGAVVGIVSWGRGCAQPGYPGVYSDVDNLREFIEEQIQQ